MEEARLAYYSLVVLLRRYLLRQQKLEASFRTLLTRIGALDSMAWDARRTDISTHTSGEINRIRESLLDGVTSAWAEYCAGLPSGRRRQLLLYRNQLNRLCEEYANHRAFDVVRCNTDAIMSLANGDLVSHANDFLPTAYAALASYLAADECGSHLEQHLLPLAPGPNSITRHAIRHDNGVKILKALCMLIREMTDNMRRSIFALGFKSAASHFSQSSEWMDSLQVDINVLYYGAMPDYQGHDNSHYRPNAVHTPLVLRPWLEAVVFMKTFKQKTALSEGLRRWSTRRSYRLGDREKATDRLKLYLDHGIITNEQYSTALRMYEVCSETIHSMDTRFMTDAWVIWKYIPSLETAIIQGFVAWKGYGHFAGAR